MDIKDLRGDDGSFSEDKVGDLINKFTDLKGKNEDLSTKVSQFDDCASATLCFCIFSKFSCIILVKFINSSSELISCNNLCRTCWFTAACA
jgi:hypothetical protein